MISHRQVSAGVIALVAALLAGCSGDSADPGSAPPSRTESTSAPSSGASGDSTAEATVTPSGTATGRSRARNPHRVKVDQTVATGLEVPWGVAPLGGGRALVAERPTGRILLAVPGQRPVQVGEIDGVLAQGEGGLLGLAIDHGGPNEDRAGPSVFAYFTSTEGDNRVVRMSYANGRLSRPTTIVTGIPAGSNHDGGRMVIGPDRKLWIGTGETGRPQLAQDLESLGGKILRVELDGSVPADNPFAGSPVWSYGHRNVQGLAFDSAGQLWATEFGQSTWDELNLIVKGANYGWPQIEGKAGGGGGGGVPLRDYRDPQLVWTTREASPSGLAIVDDVAYVAGLRGERLWQVPLLRGKAGKPRALLVGELGRLRTVERDGAADALWLTTSNTDGRGRLRSGDDRLLLLDLT